MICILVVEKDGNTREALVDMILKCGYQAVSYADARSAFNTMRGITFDLMITGIGVVNDSTPSLLIEARALQPGMRIVIGVSQVDQLLSSRIADACISKTLSLDELEGVILKALDAVLNGLPVAAIEADQALSGQSLQPIGDHPRRWHRAVH